MSSACRHVRNVEDEWRYGMKGRDGTTVGCLKVSGQRRGKTSQARRSQIRNHVGDTATPLNQSPLVSCTSLTLAHSLQLRQHCTGWRTRQQLIYPPWRLVILASPVPVCLLTSAQSPQVTASGRLSRCYVLCRELRRRVRAVKRDTRVVVNHHLGIVAGGKTFDEEVDFIL